MARLIARSINIGHIHLNDLRMYINMKSLSSRDIIDSLVELESRDYGHIKNNDDPDPIFVINVPAFQTLIQSHRLTDQAPHI